MYPLINVAYAAEQAAKTESDGGIPIPMVVMTIIILIPVAIFLLTKLKSGIDDKYNVDEEATSEKTKTVPPAEGSAT